MASIWQVRIAATLSPSVGHVVSGEKAFQFSTDITWKKMYCNWSLVYFDPKEKPNILSVSTWFLEYTFVWKETLISTHISRRDIQVFGRNCATNHSFGHFIDGKLKQTLATINNSQGHIGNSINNRDFLDNDYTTKAKMRRDDDTISEGSLGSHRNRKLKSDAGSHKGSSNSLDGEEKKDASKDDLDDGEKCDGREVVRD